MTNNCMNKFANYLLRKREELEALTLKKKVQGLHREEVKRN